MTQHIHICPIGFYPEPCLMAIGGPMPMDKIYLLYNENENCVRTLNTVNDAFLSINQKDVVSVKINPFDYNDVVTQIMKIHHDECKKDPDTKIYINFTSGTNIVAGACTSVSYFIGATLYYIMDQRVCKDLNKTQLIRIIKTPKIPEIEKMKKMTRTILGFIATKDDGVFIKDVCEHMYSKPQNMNYHFNILLESGLITKEKCGREIKLKITEQGKMFNGWIEEDSFV